MTLKELGRRSTVPLRRAAYHLKLQNSERWLLAGEEGTRLRRFVGAGLWNVDSIDIGAGEITVNGWALTPVFAPADLSLVGNGRGPVRSEFGHSRPDLGVLYPYLANAGSSGFSTTFRHDVAERELRLEVHHPHGPVAGLPPFFARLEDDTLPVPDAARMRRVHGDDNPVAFRVAGYDRFRKLEEALRRAAGHGFEPDLRILDWGCGSGRVSRNFALRPGVVLTGVDVDGDNAQWCAAHLPVGSFQAIPLHPPTSFAAASFDVVIGVSVFTHLTEEVQFEWLRELKRLTRPGGWVLVSVHAFAAVAQQAAWPLWVLQAWEDRGFIDGKSHDLDGYLAEADYYRTTLHHPDYIRREWTKVFSVVDIIEGYLGNQALCILEA